MEEGDIELAKRGEPDRRRREILTNPEWGDRYPVLTHVKLPRFSEDLPLEDRIKTASIYIHQAANGRNMHLSLEDHKDGVKRGALRAYWWYANLRWPRLLLLILLALVLFFERAPYCWDDLNLCFVSASGVTLPRSGIPILSIQASLAMELIAVIGLWLCDPFLKLFFIKRFHWLIGWDGARTLIYLLYCIDVIVSYGLPRPWRVSPWARVLVFSMVSFGSRNAMYVSALVLWAVADIILFVAGFLLLMSWVGIVLFSGSPAAGIYFPSFVRALASLQITLTTANFPDVMVPQYDVSPAALLFYVIFFALGLYFLLPLTLASIYTTFRGRLGREGTRFRRNRIEMLRSAFSIMSFGHSGYFISLSMTEDLLTHLNGYVTIPYTSYTKKSLLVDYLSGTGDRPSDDRIEEKKFLEILMALSSKVVQTEYNSPLADWFPKWGASRCFEYFEKSVVKYLTWFIDVVVLADVALSVYATAVLLEAPGRPPIFSPWIQASFVFVYTIEMVLKLLVMGLGGYWARALNRFDAALTVSSLAVTIVVLIPNAVDDPLLIRVFTLIRVFRLFRIFSRLQRVRVITATLFRVGGILGRALLPLLVYYTFFSLLGMTLFGGKLYQGNPLLTNSSYINAGYINTSNWNDAYSSWSSLFALMIVNNWFIISEGPELVTSSSARIFFVIWWLLSVLVNVNIFVALLIDSFSAAETAEANVLAEGEDGKEKLLASGISLYDVAS